MAAPAPIARRLGPLSIPSSTRCIRPHGAVYRDAPKLRRRLDDFTNRRLRQQDGAARFRRVLGRWPKPVGALDSRRDTSRLLRSSTMIVHGVTPILNVSDMDASFAWFAKLGWKELWRWGDPTGFGAVGSGPCEIFMCRGGQGGRGKGKNTSTFARFEDETQDKGCWMSWWVEDVDAVYEQCVTQGIEVTWPPTDMPWNVREMHVRHPDGHVFRIGKGLKEE